MSKNPRSRRAFRLIAGGYLSSFLLSVLCLFGQPESVGGQVPAAAAKSRKVLFLGNSITWHGAKPSIGWTGTWGMAASAENKDYVHVVKDALAQTWGVAPEVMIKNIAEFERNLGTYDLAGQLAESIAFGADTIVLAIGENVPALATEEAKAQLKSSVSKLIATLKGSGQPLLIVRSCFWQNPAKDQILKEVCVEAGGIFVDISHLGKDEANYARSERKFQHDGVARHPGDRGMQAIGEAIVKGIQSESRSPAK